MRQQKQSTEAVKRTSQLDYKEKDWGRDNFAGSNVLEELKANCNDTLERINYNEVSVGEFVDKYVKPSRPVVIRGVTEQWPGKEIMNWRVAFMLHPGFLRDTEEQRV